MVARRTMPAIKNRINKYKKFIKVEDKDVIVIISNSYIHFILRGLNRYEVNLNLPR